MAWKCTLLVVWMVLTSIVTEAALTPVTTENPPAGTRAVPSPGTTENPPAGTTTAPPAGTTAALPAGTTAAPPAGTTAAPPSGTTAAPPAGSTAAPPAGTTAAPPAGTTAAPPAGTTAAPPAGTTAAPPVGTTAAPPAGTTAAPPAGTTAAPPAGTTAAPTAGTTAAPPAGTTAAPPAGTTAAPPAGTTAAPPAGTTAAPPAGTTAAPPAGTTAPPPAGTTAAPPAGTTAAPPAGTTAAPPAGTTAAPPAGTTAAPPSGTTAAPPAGSTAVPPAGTTTAPPAGTTAAPPAGTTAAPTAGTTAAPPPGTTAVTLPVTTTEKPDPCQSNPCGGGSTCEPRGNGTVCLCQPGDSYDEVNMVCVQAKVFPGEVNLQKTYIEQYGDKSSQEFKDLEDELWSEISSLFEADQKPKAFVVEEFLEVNPTSRSGGKVKAIYQLFFDHSSTITTEEVKTELKDTASCEDCVLLKDSTFTPQTLCDRAACDKPSTDCNSENGGYKCSCKEGYVNTILSDRVCLVACPDGQYLTDTGCEMCPFGWSGFNCKDSWKLVLVIVGSVFGGLLLATSISLIIVALKPSKNGSKKAKHSGTGNLLPDKGPHNGTNGKLNTGYVPEKGKVPFPDIGVPRIPRATTNSSWDSRTNLEMTPSNSRQNLVPSGKNSRLYEELNEMNPHSRPQNAYAHARPQNPYAQNRANINPYAQNQGRTNPYYMDDDRRRY